MRKKKEGRKGKEGAAVFRSVILTGRPTDGRAKERRASAAAKQRTEVMHGRAEGIWGDGNQDGKMS